MEGLINISKMLKRYKHRSRRVVYDARAPGKAGVIDKFEVLNKQWYRRSLAYSFTDLYYPVHNSKAFVLHDIS